MQVWKLTIEYEGTRYRGWQEQKNARTIAGELGRAARTVCGPEIEIGGAGRTDAGVHALAQVAHLRTDRRLKTGELARQLNDNLPADINVLKVEQTTRDFHARRSALARSYLYQISTRRTAFAKQYVWWVKDGLDFEAMQKVSALLVGRHNFVNFSEPSTDDRSTIVVVDAVELALAADLVLLRITASHFLWKMVRRIVGALVELGRGNISQTVFANLLDPERMGHTHTDFKVAAHTAPPSGLFLERVIYDRSERLAPIAPAFEVRSVFNRLPGRSGSEHYPARRPSRGSYGGV
ncbi:MAG TPA: tRNA pseudouridine(38-40) synthase TruA [Blastocatellia bacterium]|nr:tRNA pseudouridine(38-40) synthase TruA [Blastocatellia bacterium]